jgi:uncharacterized FAD-dependent dehydrogenase
MKKQIEIAVYPDRAADRDFHKNLAAIKLNADINDITALIPLRRSIDARKAPLYRILYDVYLNETPVLAEPRIDYSPAVSDKRVIVTGFGPGGMFAALRLIEAGIRPIILERGKNVRERPFDISAILKRHIVNPDSNYCFGEGGAGTYSDGKLYTRSTKRGDVKKILAVFVQHGADPDILVDTHPHIGSNRLPKIVAAIRETIIANGGEIHFNSRVTDLVIKNKKLTGVIVNDSLEFSGDAVILATGHSAVDVYYMLKRHDIRLEAKPFAMGVRIEHPQSRINEIQYHSKDYSEYLPPASYSLACRTGKRGAFSFCMCPGGIIVPAATSANEQVVNGMSVSRRDSPFANSGIVVTVDEEDWAEYKDENEFAGLKLRMGLEKMAFELGGNSQCAPAQRAMDFLKGIQSASLNTSSYIPGIVSAPLHECLPEFMVKGLREALTVFNRKMKGFSSSDAQLIGIETRTSSPLRIPRDREAFSHPDLAGLFPCGEGAGYAGGIISAAVDGENCAMGAIRYFK